MDNCYEGGMTKWVNVLKAWVAKVDDARYNLQLWSMAFTISGTARPRIKNDNDMLYPSVCNDETIDDEENNQWLDIDQSYDSSIPDTGRGSHDDEDCQYGVGSGFGSVGGHGCAGPSGFATFSCVSFREDGLCDDIDQTSEHASPRAWIILGSKSELLAPKLQVHMQSLKPKGIVVKMQVEHGLYLLYLKAWRAKDHAEASVFGSPKQSFKLSSAYCHRLNEVNPRTITAIKTNVSNQFEYMFIAHAVSLHGFRNEIRPVIAIDDTHLKGKFSGIMFVAICLDTNNQVFPLAYGFGDIEDEMSWTWFLNELKNAIGSPKDCMIISDRHLDIKAAMEKVYPNVPYGYCVFHMAQNIKNDYERKDVSLLFKQAWKTYRKSKFEEAMLEMMKVNRVAFEDLMIVGPKRYAKKLFLDYCGDCYKTTSWVEAYTESIFPVRHPSEWNIPEDVRSKIVLPLPFRAKARRPRKKRFKYVQKHGNGKTRNCTICKKYGHKRKNCRNAQPCQAPLPCPSAISTTSATSTTSTTSKTFTTSATSKRPRRPYRCKKCREEGHNSQKCALAPKVIGTT
ncbi:hypothetical protein Ddye_000846 [Dipteronia dyeriana]|uniref:CCHC-type domain-containing protein n=1 Tax=Dipteronia dyeriana TaxID=168575 RepID=A0AAD9XMU7_9ROSI|nr:hypothetical protein Ddye_000846 [Dipteronia dyeriana]